MIKCVINTLVGVGLFGGTLVAREGEKPNIILMMADDLGWGDVGAFNPKTPIKTPHLDEMAKAGMKFDRFYASSPVCSPTRGSSITGRHPFRYGVYYANTGNVKDEELTIAELLKEKGYVTGHFGKWHLGTMTTEMKDANRGGPGNPEEFSPPWKHGFDVCFSTESKVPTWDPMLKPGKDEGWNNGKKGWDAIKDKSTADAYGTHYWNAKGEVVKDNLEGDDSRVIIDRVVPFVEKAAEETKPFFAVVWFHTPHLPVVAGPEYAAMYPGVSDFEKNYNGCVTAMDEQVGRLRAVLKEAGVAENTMVWFCSDNGPEGSDKSPGSAADFKGRKRSLSEGGVRVPGILDWPARVKAGTVTDFPAVTSDYLPTILDVVGAEYIGDRPLDGISLLPVISGEKKEREKGIGFQCRGTEAWSTQRYKIYKGKKNQPWKLYDLIADPSEKNDLAAEHPEIVKELAKKFNDWRASCKESDQGKDYKDLKGVLNEGAEKPGADEDEFFTPKKDRKSLTAKSKKVEGLPNVLIIGDSISAGYTEPVIAELDGVANVSRIPENGGDTGRGLVKIDRWLGDENWDVIHFNWGLWDLCYRHPKSRNQGKRDKVNGTITHSLEEYADNLEKLVVRLKETDAKLIWAMTTFVPDKELGRVKGDDDKYNAVAEKIMKKHGVAINDLNTFSEGIQEHAKGAGDVHYTEAGSELLGKKVAEEIKTYLNIEVVK